MGAEVRTRSTASPTSASVVTERLDNGLTVTVATDHSSPAAVVAVHYGVGFRADPEAMPGLVHLLEHVMLQDRGGLVSASTHQDYTDFYGVVAHDDVDASLALEAARLRGPALSPAVIRSQVGVVEQEIVGRTRRPYGGFPWPAVSPVLFSTFPNAHDGYGHPDRLRDVTVEECQRLLAEHYVAANAVLTITGSLDPAPALELAEQHFGSLPRRPRPSTRSWSEPALGDDVHVVRADPFAAQPALAVGYRLPDPAAGRRSLLALSLLAEVVIGGARLRLAAAELGIVSLSARCGLFDLLDARDPDVWLLTAVHPPSAAADRLAAAFDAELSRLATKGPRDDELALAVARRINAHCRAMDDPISRARALGRMALLFGDAGAADELPTDFARIDAAGVADAARGLVEAHRAVLEMLPASPGRS